MVIFKCKQKKCEGNVKIKYHGKKLDPTESVKYPGFSNSVQGQRGFPAVGADEKFCWEFFYLVVGF